MDFTKFQHCLRMQITADDLAEKRISDLVFYCKEYGFTNVMLMINAEEFNRGHITVQEAKPWVAVLKEAKQQLEQNGITVSLNNWIEIGHLDRCRTLKDGQNFTTMVDKNGNKCQMVACPLDENWKSYFIDYAKYLVRELQPDTFWIEDDFRYHNHEGLEWGGCFCQKHMDAYNSVLSTCYTREQFVKKVFRKGKPSKERKAWLDVSKNSMVSLAQDIANAVKEEKADINIAIMTSSPENHCLEMRDWHSLMSALENNHNKINRCHLPAYSENQGRGYYYYFNSISMAIRALCGDDTVFMPETENCSANYVLKSPEFMRFQVESAIPLLIKGMTYSIYDFVGNGVVSQMKYGDKVKLLTPYLQAVKDVNVKFSDLSGVIVPISEDIDYRLPIKNGYKDLLTNQFTTGGYLALQGVAYQYSLSKSFRNKTVALFGDSTFNFTDSQLEKLFKNNFVIIDGGAVLNLLERNLGSLIGVKSAKLFHAESDVFSYEECVDGQLVYGIEHFRATCRSASGSFVKIDYSKDYHVHTKVFDYEMNEYALGIVSSDNLMVVPYVINDFYFGQFSELRRHFVVNAVQSNFRNDYLCMVDNSITPYMYKLRNGFMLIFTNTGLDSLDKFSFAFSGSGSICDITSINKDGTRKPVEYSVKDGIVTIKHSFDGLSTMTLLVKTH